MFLMSLAKADALLDVLLMLGKVILQHVALKPQVGISKCYFIKSPPRPIHYNALKRQVTVCYDFIAF